MDRSTQLLRCKGIARELSSILDGIRAHPPPHDTPIDTPVDTPLSAFDSVARALLPVGMDPTGIATPEAAVENRRAGVEAEREDWLLVLGRSLGIDFGS